MLAADFLLASDFLLAADFLVDEAFLLGADFASAFLLAAAVAFVPFLAALAVFFVDPALFPAAAAVVFFDALVDFLVAVVLSSSDGAVFRADFDVVEDLAWAMAFLAKRSMHDVPPTRQAGTAIHKLQINKHRRAPIRT